MERSLQNRVHSFLYFSIFIHFTLKRTSESTFIPNLGKTLGRTYLKSHTLQVYSALSTFNTAVRKDPLFQEATIALSEIDLHSSYTNVSGKDNYPEFLEQKDPSITLGLPNNKTDFWTIFKLALNSEEIENSQHFHNEGRIVMMVWPEKLKVETVADVVEDSIRYNSILEKFKNLFAMDKIVLIFFPVLNATGQFYEIYYIKELLVIEKVHTNYTQDIYFIKNRRCTFRRVEIISVTQADPDYQVYTKYTNINGTLALTGGLAHGVLHFMSRNLNFTLHNILGTGWIGQGPNGTLTGMGNQLLKKEADVIFSPSELILYRQKKISMSHPFQTVNIRVYFHKPTGTSMQDMYFCTFSTNLWIAILIMWLILGLSFKFVHIYQSNQFDTEPLTINHIEFCGNMLLWSIGTASQQGWHLSPSGIPLRIIFFSGTIASVFIYVVFGSYIISRLSVEKAFFETISDLMDSGFSLYAQEGALNAIDIVKARIAGKNDVNSFSFVLNRSEGIEKIRTTKSAFISPEGRFFGTEPASLLCSLQSRVKVENGRVLSVLWFRKDDPTRKFFYYRFAMWRERGLFKRLQHQYDRETLPLCEDIHEMNYICLVDVSTAFLIFGIGLTLSMIFLATETFKSVSSPEKYSIYK